MAPSAERFIRGVSRVTLSINLQWIESFGEWRSIQSVGTQDFVIDGRRAFGVNGKRSKNSC